MFTFSISGNNPKIALILFTNLMLQMTQVGRSLSPQIHPSAMLLEGSIMLKERHGILILALSALVIVDGFCARLKFALRYCVKTLVVLKTLAALIAKVCQGYVYTNLYDLTFLICTQNLEYGLCCSS